MFYQIVSDVFKQQQVSICNKFIHSTSRLLENHYDVLKLKKNCTAKQIRDSYIKLSKENHPDRNKNKKAHENFVKITEAYNVLSKPHLRNSYDLGLSNPYGYKRRQTYEQYDWKKQQNTQRNPWDDQFFYQNRDKAKDNFYNRRAYYGINGLNRVSNAKVVLFCVIFTFLGVLLQVYAISRSFTFHRDDLMKKSIAYQTSLNRLNEIAELHGNAKQVELLKHRLGIKDEEGEAKHQYEDDTEADLIILNEQEKEQIQEKVE